MAIYLVFIGFVTIFVNFVEPFPKLSSQDSFNNEVSFNSLKSEKRIKIFHFVGNYDPDVVKALRKSQPIPSADLIDKLIPDRNKIIFVIKLEEPKTHNEVIHDITEAVAKHLNIELDNVKISKYEPQTGIVKVFFMHTTSHKNNTDIVHIKPASEMMEHFVKKRLQNAGGAVKIVDIFDGSQTPYPMTNNKMLTVMGMFSDKNWQTWQIAMLITCCLFAIFCLTAMILVASSYRITKNKIGPVEEPRRVVVQPILRPAVAGVGVIQPENRDQFVEEVVRNEDPPQAEFRLHQAEPLLPESDSEHTPSPSRSPMRRGRGLLERRGSNASLTLDLGRSQENIHCGTPPKECSTGEYLQSAGKRLTRRQLQTVLKDVKALHTEFWEIPMNHPEKVEVAGSGTKNRYKTILPNETSRVQLYERSGDPLASYINANYVRGYAGEVNAYIATQGPLPHTVDDFWQMVWKEKSPIIVMITKLKEKLKVKCEPYIPDFQDRYGDIEVTVTRVIPRDGYTIRELFLMKGAETHTVLHFWYTTWPDHKTPETAKQMLGMALEVESLRHDNSGATKGPMIVHCSAGIGRTGCFIAASIGIQQLLEENTVDVLGIVCSLRMDRGGMIQTAEQYEFVHQALSIFEHTLPASSVD